MLYYSSVVYNSRVIALCLVVLPAYYFIHVYGALLTAHEHFRLWIGILIIASTVNIILNLFLIPSYGAEGCCIAALVSQYFCAALVAVLASRRSTYKLHYETLILYAVVAAISAAIFYFARLAFINVWIILAVASGISLLLLATRLKSLKRYFISLR